MTFAHGGNIHGIARQVSCRPSDIRNCDNFQGLSDQFIRISLKDQETNRSVATMLKERVRNVLLKPEEGRIAC